MEWVETTGKSVEEAKEAALDQLGVHETDAEFVVLEEPKVGFLGRIKGEARVRARVRPTAPRPKRGRSRRSDESSRQAGQGRGGGRERGGEGARQSQKPAVAGGTANGSPTGYEAEAASGGGVAVATGATSGAGARKRRRRGGRGRGGSGGAGRGGTGEAPNLAVSAETGEGDGGAGGAAQRTNGNGAGGRARSSDKGKEETVAEELSLEEQGEAARRFVDGLVREMGLEAEVSARVVDEDTAEVVVTGDELGLLIGPGGATLSALQEVTRTVVQRHTGGHSDRIIVDVAGYRAKRAEALARFACKIADEVLESGEERVLEPMTPPDRKVVHDTVNEIEGVATRSEGEEPRRYIVISPTAASATVPGDDDA